MLVEAEHTSQQTHNENGASIDNVKNFWIACRLVFKWGGWPWTLTECCGACVCVCVCVYVCMYVCIYTSAALCARAHTHTHTCGGWVTEWFDYSLVVKGISSWLFVIGRRRKEWATIWGKNQQSSMHLALKNWCSATTLVLIDSGTMYKNKVTQKYWK